MQVIVFEVGVEFLNGRQNKLILITYVELSD